MMEQQIIIEKNGKVRSADTLEVLGYWFEVDGVKYYCPLYKLDKV